MEYVTLGNTGLDVSRICLGCMGFGDAERWVPTWGRDEDASRPVIRHALGITCFDTANISSLGASEEILGRALKDFANRDEIVIATKVHGRRHAGPNGAGLSRKAILSEIDRSLRRLGTTRTDHRDAVAGALSVTLTPEQVASLEEPYTPHPVVGPQ